MRWGGRPSRSLLCPRKRPSATPVQHVKMDHNRNSSVLFNHFVGEQKH